MVSARVLLSDDHPIVMSGFANALASYGIEVVGQVVTLEQVLPSYDALLPDVLILDIRFGSQKETGLDAARHVLAAHPTANVIFLSQFDQDSLIKEAYQLGGRAFLTKDCNPADLAAAVARAKQGELYFMPTVAERLASLSILGERTPQALLQDREVDIFKLMAQGLTNTEIAERLSLSPKTISNSSQTIKDKLGVSRPADITRLAVRMGYIEP
ncbi:MAG: response regulator transcription factor [Ottowia sp.]|nr:response regulator transcription factor [Ottowia sp.]